MSNQIGIDFADPALTVYEIPEFVACGSSYANHPDFAPQAYYADADIIKMIDEQGFIDCPFCLDEICSSCF